MSTSKREPGIFPINEHNEDVVISGISGRFPESESMEEFKKNLFEGIDMVTEDNTRWPPGIYGTPTRIGKLKNLQYFDATFFGVPAKQAEVMDPQMRILIEVAYEAMVDAGVNPTTIRGSRIGVFIGANDSDADTYWLTHPQDLNGYELLGCSRAHFANRLSYTFDFKGPSFTIDTGCSSGLYALQQAYIAILTGQCDAAIVGGTSLNLSPVRSMQFHRLGMLSLDGKCKSFDSTGDGYVRSEGNVVLFLQKFSNAKRIYASILGIKTNIDGYKENGITYPSGEMQSKLVRDVYKENNIDPHKVTYVETHGTGTKAGDPEEVNAIADIFCKNRKHPLLIGSVKSNMGHSEAAAAVCSLARIIIALESGMIPANLHFNAPREDIPGLHDGRLKVVSEHEPFKGGLIGVNSFGFGGANAHAILQANPKQKQLYPKGSIPRLICVSGRTQESVNYFLNESVKFQDDLEFLALVDEISSSNSQSHPYRGYAVLGDHLIREVSQTQDTKRPIWFVYSGMGSQWSGMATDLMKFDVFKESIKKSANTLRYLGINLEEIMLQKDGLDCSNILGSLVAITAMQVALTDLLCFLGIKPDGIIGHSTGEIGCAYGDGSLTNEQALLSAYARARAVLDTKLPPGSMASVGLSLEKAQIRCPPEIEISCHNGRDNVTISGPPDILRKFICELAAENIFVREVNVCGFAFHSKYVNDAGPKMGRLLHKVILSPEVRTSRWLSSSVPESEWTKPLAKLCSAEYFVNNFLSPVLFHEVLQHVPENAITIEVAPNGLMQAIFKRSLDESVTNLSLVKKEHSNNIEFLLSNLGKLYVAGAQPKIHKLYPKVNFPVGRGTPNIASMIKWDHSIEWGVPYFSEKKLRGGEHIVKVDLSNEEDKFLTGHLIDGLLLYPATGYLVLVWRTLARLRNEEYQNMPVVYENVDIYRPTIIPREGSVEFTIHILEGSGDFELCEGGMVLVSGRIYVPEALNKERLVLLIPEIHTSKDALPLLAHDIYKQLHLVGYEYNELFRGILEADNWARCCKLLWNNNWVTYMDTMLQLLMVGKDKVGLYLPTRFQRVVIDPQGHLNHVTSSLEKQGVPVHIYHDINVIQSGGIQFRGIYSSSVPRKQPPRHLPRLHNYQFVQYENYLAKDVEMSDEDALTVLLQIVSENNINVTKLKVTEVLSSQFLDSMLLPKIKIIFNKEPTISVEACVITRRPVNTTLFKDHDISILVEDIYSSPVDLDGHLIVLTNILDSKRSDIFSNVSASLRPGGFVLVQVVSGTFNHNASAYNQLSIVAIQRCQTNTYALLRKPIELPRDPIIIPITGNNFTWLEPLKAAMKKSETDGVKIYVYTQGEKLTGLIGMVNCLIREPGGQNLRSFFIPDPKAPIFNTNKYKNQMRKDLVHNVWKNGAWGSYRHLLLDTSRESRVLAVKHAYIDIITPGDLSSLRWIQQPLARYQGKESVLCTVYYAALNFRDVLLATRKISKDTVATLENLDDNVLGMEFSGRDANGKRVMGAVRANGLATSVLPSEEFLWPVPDHWTLEQAATVPITYLTVYYALIMRGRMQPGESILIHAGTGAVGQSAISVAIHMGCTVFTTVSTQEKRDFVKKTFPEVIDENIGYSRDTSFEQLVLSRTKGRGVDLVLNSLAGEQLQASARCLAPGGRFLEIGKVDLINNSSLGMSLFVDNTSFHGVCMNYVFLQNYRPERRELSRLLSEGIANGAVRPLPAIIYDEDHVEQAFRYLGSGMHIGKVIIKIKEEDNFKIHLPTPKNTPAICRIYMNPHKSYVIVGGLGGFGIELVKWLVSRGARHFVLGSRSGVRTGYQSLWLRRWTESGISVHVSTEDITNEEGVQRLIQDANKLAPVSGIFNLAVLLRDDLIDNLTEANFSTVCKPKIEASRYLDIASRRLTPQLDYFVCFSSVFCGYGNQGQSNYGFANSAMERICEARREAGFPGLAIQWGLVGEVGVVAEKISNSPHLEINGIVPQQISSCLSLLDLFLQQQHPVVGSLVLAEKLKKADKSQISMANAVANILGIKDSSTIIDTVTLTDLGMDSIMGTEVKQSLERKYDCLMTIQEIRKLTFQRLMELSNTYMQQKLCKN